MVEKFDPSHNGDAQSTLRLGFFEGVGASAYIQTPLTSDELLTLLNVWNILGVRELQRIEKDTSCIFPLPLDSSTSNRDLRNKTREEAFILIREGINTLDQILQTPRSIRTVTRVNMVDAKKVLSSFLPDVDHATVAGE